MAVKKQPDTGVGELSEAANDWFRQFVKLLELFMVETGQGLPLEGAKKLHRLLSGFDSESTDSDQ